MQGVRAGMPAQTVVGERTRRSSNISKMEERGWWMEATTVLPSPARSFRVCITRCAWNESSPLVGSSASHPRPIALWLFVNALIAFSIG